MKDRRNKWGRRRDAGFLRAYRNYLRSTGMRVIGVYGAKTVETAAALQRQDSAKQRKCK